MFSRRYILHLKTTLLGLIVIAASIAYPYFVSQSSVWIFGIMFCVGLALLFLPNAFITSLKRFVKTNSDREL